MIKKNMTGWDMNVLENLFAILLSGDNPIFLGAEKLVSK